MNRSAARTAVLLLLSAVSTTALPASTLTVNQPWIREAPPTAQVMAGYMTLINPGDTPVIVTTISSPDFTAVELHRTLVTAGIARMLPVKQLDIPAHSRITLEPGGLHLMLIEPQRSLREGTSVELVLHSGDTVCITVSAPVIRSTGAADHSHDH